MGHRSRQDANWEWVEGINDEGRPPKALHFADKSIAVILEEDGAAMERWVVALCINDGVQGGVGTKNNHGGI